MSTLKKGEAEGALFPNRDKDTDTKPNAKGNIIVCCPECSAVNDFWLSAWTNTAGPNSKNPGMKYQSLKANAKHAESSPSRSPSTSTSVSDDEDIPF